MKILVLCGAGLLSGKEKMILHFFDALNRKKDFELYCVMSKWGCTDFEGELTKRGIFFKKLYLGFISKSFSFRAILMSLHQMLLYPNLIHNFRKTLIEYKPDIIIHTNYHHLFLLYPSLSSTQKHIYYNHDSLNQSNFLRRLFSFFSKRIDLFICPSEFSRNQLVQLGIDRKKLCTIHNCVDPIRISKKDTRIVDCSASDFFNVGIVGQIAEWKGHEDLISSLYHIESSIRKNIKLKIFGLGSPQFIDHLSKLIDSHGLKELVEFSGFYNSMEPIYAQLDLVCVPSRFDESFGLSSLEPAYFSVPVLVTNSGGLTEIVTDGHNGFVVPRRRPDLIARKIEFLYLNNESRKEMGKHHHEVLINKFSFDSFSEKWVKILKTWQ